MCCDETLDSAISSRDLPSFHCGRIRTICFNGHGHVSNLLTKCVLKFQTTCQHCQPRNIKIRIRGRDKKYKILQAYPYKNQILVSKRHYYGDLAALL